MEISNIQSFDQLINAKESNQIDDAIFISKLLEFEKQEADEFERFRLYLALGSSYCFDGSSKNLTLAEKYLLQAENDFKKEVIKGNEWKIYFHLGHLYSRKNQPEKAKEYFIKYNLCPTKTNEFKIESDFFSFRKIDKFTIADLVNDEITLSNPEKFNDPYDTLLFPFINYRKRIINEKEKYDINSLIEAHDAIRVRCFSTYSIEKNKPVQPILNRLLWSHYADEFKGICVVYKFPRFQDGVSFHLKENSLTEWYRVDYKDSLTFIDATKAARQYLFATKHKDWNYENEVRLVHYDPTVTKEQQHIQLPLEKFGGEIKAIILGSRCSTKDEQTIREIFKGKDFFFRIQGIDSVIENDDIYTLKIDNEEKWYSLNPWLEPNEFIGKT